MVSNHIAILTEIEAIRTRFQHTSRVCQTGPFIVRHFFVRYYSAGLRAWLHSADSFKFLLVQNMYKITIAIDIH